MLKASHLISIIILLPIDKALLPLSLLSIAFILVIVTTQSIRN